MLLMVTGDLISSSLFISFCIKGKKVEDNLRDSCGEGRGGESPAVLM